MKTIKEDDILKLRQSGNVRNSSGGNLKSILPFADKKKAAPVQTAEERTAKAVENIAEKLAAAAKDNGKHATILMDMLRKVIIKPDLKIPAFPRLPQPPEPIKQWNFVVERDRLGFIETIKAEAG